MTCDDVAYPYLETTTGLRKHVGVAESDEGRCVIIEVFSNAGEVPIEVSHVDDNGDQDGVTEFCRVYDDNGPVQLMLVAPPVAQEIYGFRVWVLDGIEQEPGNVILEVLVGASECRVAIARFGGVIDPINNGGCFDGISFPEVITVSGSTSFSGPPRSGCCGGPSTATIMRTAWGAYPHVKQVPIESINNDGIPIYSVGFEEVNPGCNGAFECPPDCQIVGAVPLCLPPDQGCGVWHPRFWRWHAVNQRQAWFQPTCACVGKTGEPDVARLFGWAGLMYFGGASSTAPGPHCISVPGVNWGVGVADTVENETPHNGSMEDCQAKIKQLINSPLTATNSGTSAGGIVWSSSTRVIM